jgi:hypothetical protein
MLGGNILKTDWCEEDFRESLKFKGDVDEEEEMSFTEKEVD